MPARTLAWHAHPEGGEGWKGEEEEEEEGTQGNRADCCRDVGCDVLFLVKGSRGETLLCQRMFEGSSSNKCDRNPKST